MYLYTARANTNILGAHRATHPYMHTNKPVFGAVAAISLFLANTCVREKDKKKREKTEERDNRRCIYAWSKVYVW